MKIRYKNGSSGSYWMNSAPIKNPHAILEALVVQWREGRDSRYIFLRGGVPELCIQWYREGDSGGDSSGVHYLEIDPDAAKQLIKDGLVRPQVVKYLGGSYEENDTLVLSEKGARRLKELNEEQCKIAHDMLQPGVHSKFSGIFDDAGHEWSPFWEYEEISFDFRTPQGEKVRVFPASKRVEKLPEEKVA